MIISDFWYLMPSDRTGNDKKKHPVSPELNQQTQLLVVMCDKRTLEV